MTTPSMVIVASDIDEKNEKSKVCFLSEREERQRLFYYASLQTDKISVW